ncbi:MAG: SLBB domain-containing protein, partial [Desulfohalobiaceae bacterium]|nr:SLBB domain-containing protein [Desulfohalobiaceae bacterium]
MKPKKQILFQNRRPDRAATFDEYRASGGYKALEDSIRNLEPAGMRRMVLDSGLRGRGGAGFPTGVKWKGVPQDGSGPRYVVCNTDEMEPGTFKDRVLVNVDPHLVIEGMVLAGYAVQASEAFFFIRPSYEQEAELIERELEVARQAGFLGNNILGSGFSFDVVVHRSAGRYICGEASAQIKAIQGNRPNPEKIPGVHTTERGLWSRPTLINNVETLACTPHIFRNGPQWFNSLAATEAGAGTKLYCVSGRVQRPGCYELPLGTRLGEIIEEEAGGLKPGSRFKACLPGGASSRLLPGSYYDTPMDFDSFKKKGL